MSIYWRKRLEAVGHAWRGFGWFLEEPHAKIHITIGATVLTSCGLIGMDLWEWVVVILCVLLVISIEIINTAIEKLCDKVSREWDADIVKIKDLSALAVLWVSMGADVIGGVVIVPKAISRILF